MLIKLFVRNYALIKELDIDFENGLTIITGETGAGKSAGASTTKKPTPFGDLSKEAIAAAQKSPSAQAARDLLRGVATPPAKIQPEPGPAPPPPARISPPPPISATVATRGFTLSVFSRDHPIGRDSSFSSGDQQLGELAAGDLKASVQYDGAQPPRGLLTVDWAIDGQPMGLPKPVTPNHVVEYGNEPTAGSYTVTLRLDGRTVQTFTFRITR